MNLEPSRIAVSGGMCLAMFMGDSYAQASREEPAALIPFKDFILMSPAKLTVEEVKLLLTGATTKGQAAEGGVGTREWKADGNMTGTFQNSFGYFAIAGTWRVNEKGQICSAFRATGGSFNHNRSYSVCDDWYRLGTNYYVVPAGSPAMLRQVTR